MNGKRATVAIIPRERFGHTDKTIRSVLENTQIDYNLIFVDGKTPEPIRTRVLKELELTKATILRSDSYLSPNEARNLAANAANTEFVVFLDNDTLVGPRWLEELIVCADETGAAQVGPLQFIGHFQQQTIHVAGGFLHEVNENGRKVLYDEQRLFEAKLKTLKEPLRRLPCDYIEFHCMLLKRDVLESLGGLDEHMRSVHEHIDLALELRKKDQKIYCEPKAVATYLPPQHVPWFDLPYFEIRWCEEWAVPSVEHFRRKWGYDRMGYIGENASMDLIDDTIIKFVRGHRGSVVGTQIHADDLGVTSDLTQSELELIVSAFLTVERNRFDLVGNTGGQKAAVFLKNSTAEEIFRHVDSQVEELRQGNASFALYPSRNLLSRVPCLIQIPDLSDSDLCDLANHAFLTLKKNEGSYDCWFAVSLQSGNTTDSVKEFAERIGARLDTQRPCHAIYLDNRHNPSHRLYLLHGGQILTEIAFSRLVGQHATAMVFPDVGTD
ncbi:MAG: glycosyltransferase family 2 protein [Nitrospirales bacterium]